MPDSIQEQLDLPRECEDILDCLYDVRDLDKLCYRYLTNTDQPVSVEELVVELDRDESTIHRSLNRLSEANLIVKEQETSESGGYKYIFSARDTELVKKEMELLLHQWYVQTSKLVDEFHDKYS